MQTNKQNRVTLLVLSNVISAILTAGALLSVLLWKRPTDMHTATRILQQQQCCACQNSRGRATISDFQYAGAFRLAPGRHGGDGDTFTADYAVGALAYHPSRKSLFLAGHAQQTRIAEFPLTGITPSLLVLDDVSLLPVTNDPLQGFVSPLDKANNEENLDRISGMLVTDDGSLIVNVERWYNPVGANTISDTTVFVQQASDLTTVKSGLYEMSCRSEGAGYMGNIPTEWQADFGGATQYTGWSSVYSGDGDYSHGPSLFGFSASGIQDSAAPLIATTPFMNYPFTGGSAQWLSPRATEYGTQGTPGPFPPADPIWNNLSAGVYGFFVPQSDTFAVIGSSAGLTSGLGYKAVQSNGNFCGGPCAYEPDDYYNYYWLYDINDIVGAQNVWEPRPYDYGTWDVPYGDNEKRLIVGGTMDEDHSILYVAVANAGQVGEWDRPPLIVTFQL